jgi:predicted LPLAT superfamily acyltransferase
MSTAMEPIQPTRGWRRVPERGTVLGILFVALLCKTFGRRAASGFLLFLSVYYALFHGAARRASRDYLARIGEPTTFRAVVSHFWNFARVSLDRYLFLTGRIAEFEMHQEGHDRILGAAAGALEAGAEPAGDAPAEAPKKKGAVLVGSHLGSFEAMRAIAKKTDVPITVVVDFRTAQRVNGVLAQLSPNLNFRMIGLDPTRATSMLDVKACIDRGELVAILADRVPDRSDRSTTAEFLGAPAKFPTGPFLVAHMLNCPVFLVFGLFHAPNRYDIYCEPFADVIKLPRATRNEALKTYAQKYAARLEAYARKAPYNWFNFFDFWSVD